MIENNYLVRSTRGICAIGITLSRDIRYESPVHGIPNSLRRIIAFRISVTRVVIFVIVVIVVVVLVRLEPYSVPFG
jgi:hypothetical protein